MKSTDLLLIVATLLVEIEDTDKLIEELDKTIEKDSPPEGAKIYDERAALIAKAIALQMQQDAFNERCAADLYISMFMYCWMMEVSGKPDMDVPQDLSDAAADMLIEDMGTHAKEFAEKVGGLMPQVREAMLALGYMPYETVVSKNHWAYGVACDDKEANALVCSLRSKFHRAFESKSLTLRKQFHGWRFKVLPNATAARDFLKALEEHKANGGTTATFMDDDEDDE